MTVKHWTERWENWTKDWKTRTQLKDSFAGGHVCLEGPA
jgi:hypothetical protein